MFVARVFTPQYASRDLDVAANVEHIRSGDPERTRRALGYLLELAPRAKAPTAIPGGQIARLIEGSMSITPIAGVSVRF